MHNASGAGELFRFCLRCIVQLLCHARFTFNASTTTLRYMMYVGFMGTLSGAVVGWMADKCSCHLTLTLVTFFSYQPDMRDSFIQSSLSLREMKNLVSRSVFNEEATIPIFYKTVRRV